MLKFNNINFNLLIWSATSYFVGHNHSCLQQHTRVDGKHQTSYHFSKKKRKKTNITLVVFTFDDYLKAEKRVFSTTLHLHLHLHLHLVFAMVTFLDKGILGSCYGILKRRVHLIL